MHKSAETHPSSQRWPPTSSTAGGGGGGGAARGRHIPRVRHPLGRVKSGHWDMGIRLLERIKRGIGKSLHFVPPHYILTFQHNLRSVRIYGSHTHQWCRAFLSVGEAKDISAMRVTPPFPLFIKLRIIYVNKKIDICHR